MSTLTEPHTNGHERELSGVRTYRGRKLEDLIPQIRADLGPDAIILRQREGLMGGVGGFFAQKCVEVDAQAAPRPEAPGVDIYDDDEPVNGWELTDEETNSFRTDPIAPLPPDFPALPTAEEPVAPPPVPADPVAFTTPEPEAFAAPAPEAFAAPASEGFAAPVPEGFAAPAPEGFAAPDPEGFAAPAPEYEAPAPPAEGAAESFVSRLEQAAAHVDIDELVKLVTAGGLPMPADGSEAPVADIPASDPVVPEPLAPEPVVPEAPAPMFDAPAPEPVIETLAPAPVVEIPAPPPVYETPPLAPTPVPPAATPWVAKQAGAVQPAEAAAVAQELTSQGISEAWAQQLIVAAAAHRSPLAHGSLRDAVRATLAAIIPAPAPLPATGAAVAFVGAGGAGKTRCAAALASAYAKGSTLAASVVSLGSDDWGGDLKDLLKGQNVWVMGAAVSPEAAPAVQHGRDGGLVVIDTAGVTPRDPAGVEALAGELRSLSLDAVYIAVPATFSVHAARKLVEGFAAFGADGIAVTHADEADQLGIAAELAHISGMPVAYIHEGLELDGALSAADPSSLAARLLP
jgi:flagellar biosynthesis GTPase FlhF